MARDEVLETLINDDLAAVSGLTQKAMFGGWAWLINGNLLCGARVGSVLVRLGPNKDAWALKTQGIVPMVIHDRRMNGWVRVSADLFCDDKLRQKLMKNALEFNRTLPRK